MDIRCTQNAAHLFFVGFSFLVLSGMHFQAKAQSQLVLRSDFSEVLEDIRVRIPVLRNDRYTAESFDTSSLVIQRIPSHGTTLVDHHTGTIVYTPAKDYHGLDSFEYNICTQVGHCERAIVHVVVHPVNDAPVAVNDFDTLMEDDRTMINVMGNDFDVADNTQMKDHSLTIIQGPKHGKADVVDHDIMYEPDSDYFGHDYLLYAICDESLCDTAMARFFIHPINDAPVAVNDTSLTYKGLLSVIDVALNDLDTLDRMTLDPTTITLDGLQKASHAEVFVDPQIGFLIYVPTDPYFTGTDSFEYRICDRGPDLPLCDVAKVYVTITELPHAEKPQPKTQLISNVVEVPQDADGHQRSQHSLNRLAPGSYRFSIDQQGELHILSPQKE